MGSVTLFLVLGFATLVVGVSDSGMFICRGHVASFNRLPPIKEIMAPDDHNTLSFCALQCRMYPQCQAIELCDRKETTLCKLCNFTNPTFTTNKTNSCRHLQLGNKLDVDTKSASKTHACKDILNNAGCGMVSSGVYSIYIDNKTLDVWCDMETDGGGWTVIQRRQSGNTDFYRLWDEYRTGFGNISDEYWIGNDVLHKLTTRENVTLRVDLEQFDGTKGYGTYSTFRVASESMNFKLSISGFKGDIGDCLRQFNERPFSTKDRDNDMASTNCAENRHGGWWYHRCGSTHLNGRYYTSPVNDTLTSIHCYEWVGKRIPLKRTKMMIR